MGWILQENTNNLNPLGWRDVTSGIQDDGATKTLLITPPSGLRFYRLRLGQ